MPTLENDKLCFRFEHLKDSGSFSIEFERTFRIPDTDKTYFLPPSLGAFPLRHVDDYATNLPHSAVDRGGVLMPMWQSEALWILFDPASVPVAIKVGAGKINAVTGEAWKAGLSNQPQDYMVSPEQPWLDGFAVDAGVIRQFVAMPLGDGYTAEEQLTGGAEWGGIQISVTPLTAEAWAKHRKKKPPLSLSADFTIKSPIAEVMGLGGGGRMHQNIERDPFRLEDWDVAATQRAFVTLIHAKDWTKVTGEPVTTKPLTASDYAEKKLPWFDYYAADQTPLPGSKKLSSVKSIASVHKAKTGSVLPDSQDVTTGPVIKLGPNS